MLELGLVPADGEGLELGETLAEGLRLAEGDNELLALLLGD